MSYYHIDSHFYKVDYIYYNYNQLIVDYFYEIINKDKDGVKVVVFPVR